MKKTPRTQGQPLSPQTVFRSQLFSFFPIVTFEITVKKQTNDNWRRQKQNYTTIKPQKTTIEQQKIL
jgi:hypothetical protein